MGAQLEEEYMLRNLRQHALVNNEIAERCFCTCVGGLTDRALSPKEETCVDTCAAKLIQATTRIVFKVAETSPMVGSQASAKSPWK